MGAYLDRLNEQYDEIRAGVDTLVNRAAEDGRDVTDAEQEQVDRDQTRMTELQTAIEHYSAIETQAAKVGELRRSVPATSPQTTRTKVTEPEYDITREFPTIGDYAITVHRATALKDRDAIEKLERATAHQKTTDNPGLIPRPVLGPVINTLEATRPFISSIGVKSLPAGAFDRPQVTQHVAVAKQPAEKDLTASQVLKVNKLPVTAATYAGHLNISRQDIKWSSPGILQIVFEDFAAIYAQVTDQDACDQFLASITNPVVPIASTDPGDFFGAIYGAAAASLDLAASFMPDTMWVSPDVWGSLGGATNSQGQPTFPGLSVGNANTGSPMGLKMVVDGNFPADTMVIGPSKSAEWYEDVDGLMQVGEPDVLGQLVGYAGFAAFLNVAPMAFTKFTPPAASRSGSNGDSSSKSKS